MGRVQGEDCLSATSGPQGGFSMDPGSLIIIGDDMEVVFTSSDAHSQTSYPAMHRCAQIWHTAAAAAFGCGHECAWSQHWLVSL